MIPLRGALGRLSVLFDPALWLVVALVGALGLAGIQAVRLNQERAAHAQTKLEHAVALARLATQARTAEQAAREEERRRAASIQEIADATAQDLDRAREDAARAADAAQRLRDYTARLMAACRRPAGDSPVAGGRPPGPASANLLADVQRRLDEAADGIARHADESRAAGLACERSYDALTPRKSPASAGP